MTYEEAMKKVEGLNKQNWFLTIEQSVGSNSFCAGFIYRRGLGLNAGNCYAASIPEAIALAASAAEQQIKIWAHEMNQR